MERQFRTDQRLRFERRLPRVRGLPPTFRGRRLSDPADRPPRPDTVAVRGRLAGVSVRASIAAGGWVGFALGLTIGTGAGAVIVWFAGAIVDWQRDLGFTFGIATRLLPFGDQVGLLRSLQSTWYLVIPITGLVGAMLSAVIGGLIGGLIAATYNRSPRHASVVVELPRGLPAVDSGPSMTVQGIAGTAGSDGQEPGLTDAAPVAAEVVLPVVGDGEASAQVAADPAAVRAGDADAHAVTEPRDSP